MSKVCDICGRGPKASFSVSHSKISTKRRLEINIQHRTIDGVKKNVCTRCIKTAKKK